MSERRFKKYMKRQLLNESNGRARSPFAKGSINKLQNQGVAFDEFMYNLTNYSSDIQRSEMLNMLVKFIVDMDHPESYFEDIMNDLADEFDRDGDGNHINENKTSLNEAVYTKDEILDMWVGDSFLMTNADEYGSMAFRGAGNTPPPNTELEIVDTRVHRGGHVITIQEPSGKEYTIHTKWLTRYPEWIKQIIKA